MMISCCGLDCQVCDAYVATQADDDAMRAATAEKWTKIYNHPMKAEDINCTGCRAEGAKIGHCHVCAVRTCCMDRDRIHCGACEDYGCETLEGFLGRMPDEMATANRARLRGR